NGYLTETRSYLDTGMPSQATDSCGHPSTFQYDATPYSGAYLTKSCDALNHCTTMSYNLNPGLPADVTDPNGRTTGHSYDSIGRLTTMSYPDGGQAIFTYPDANTVTRQRLITTGNYEGLQTAKFDGLGRIYQTQQVSPSGTVLADTTYDSIGRE